MLHPKAGATKFPSAWLWQEMSVNLARSSPMHCSGVSQKSLGRAQGQGSNWASWGARCAPPLAEGSPLLLWSTAGYLHFCPTSHVTPTQNLSQITAAARWWPSTGLSREQCPPQHLPDFPCSLLQTVGNAIRGHCSPGSLCLLEMNWVLPSPGYLFPCLRVCGGKLGASASLAALEQNALPKSRKAWGFNTHRNHLTGSILYCSALREAVAGALYTFVTSDKKKWILFIFLAFFEGGQFGHRKSPWGSAAEGGSPKPKALHSPHSGKVWLRQALLSEGLWPNPAAAAHTTVAWVPDQCHAYSLASQPWKKLFGCFLRIKFCILKYCSSDLTWKVLLRSCLVLFMNQGRRLLGFFKKLFYVKNNWMKSFFWQTQGSLLLYINPCLPQCGTHYFYTHVPAILWCSKRDSVWPHWMTSKC